MPLSPPDPALLLAWYDTHRRAMPWRALPHTDPNPYYVWLSEIMCQQTTVAAVIPYFERFITRFPDLETLAAAPLDDVLSLWSGLGYYARARNLHRCAIALMEIHQGAFPSDEAALLKLPGIGRYTAAAIAAIVFNTRTSPVDGNLERVMARLYAVEQPLPASKETLRKLALDLTPADRPGDFGQALMDLGATVCTPKKPDCPACPWDKNCLAALRSDTETFPRKIRKPKPQPRYGVAFLAYRSDGAVLLNRRTSEGLLGGMAEIPSTPWEPQQRAAEAALPHAPLSAQWRIHDGTVKHVFSHFPLFMQVWAATLPPETPAPTGMWWSNPNQLPQEALPTLMRKILAHAQ